MKHGEHKFFSHMQLFGKVEPRALSGIYVIPSIDSTHLCVN